MGGVLNNSDIKSIGLLVVLAFPPLLLPTYLLLNFSKAWFTILAELSMEAHLDITDKSSNLFQKNWTYVCRNAQITQLIVFIFQIVLFISFFGLLPQTGKDLVLMWKSWDKILFLFSQALLTDDKHIIFRRSSILE